MDNAQARTKQQDIYLFEDVVVYYCDSGYSESATSGSDQAIELTCTRHGNWSRRPPQCKRRLMITYL